jgi:putative transposase
MKHMRAYKYRLYPTASQKAVLAKVFGCVRFVWNKNVETFNKREATVKTSTQLRQEFDFLKEISAAAIQQKEIDFKDFKKQFFSKKRKKKLGRCQFKKKTDKQSLRLPNQKFKLVGNRLQLEKLGKIKIVVDRIPLGKFMSVTVSKTKTGEYYASILMEEEIQPKEKTNKKVGIDLGLKALVTTSDGLQVKSFVNNQNKIKHLQRHFARKKKDSRRYNQLKLKIARLYEKDARRRSWLNHNIASYMVAHYDEIIMEDLNVSGMMKNHKLAGSIQKASWADLVNKIDYKCNFYGKKLTKINRFYPSSKTCSNCGCVKEELSLSERVYSCTDCGFSIDRDHNAAINILSAGVDADYRSGMECKTKTKEQSLGVAIPDELITFL